MMIFVLWGLISLAFFSLDLQRTVGDTSITDVRFVNATSGNPGPVEVQYDGEWYHLCIETDYGREALVICRQIGYIGGWAQYFQTASPRGFNLMCGGTEDTLRACDYFEGVNSLQNCMEDISVGVWCYNSSATHLVDRPSERPNIGRVQIQYDEIVTDVCFNGGGSDRLWSFNGLQDEVLCRQLGYAGALMASPITIQNGPSLANVYTDDYKCVSSMTNLYNCLPDGPVSGRCTNDMYVHAVCASPGYVGCFPNKNFDSDYTDDNMTIQRCLELCRQDGTAFAILRNGSSCRCSGGLFIDQKRVADSECNIPCAGDLYDICGGPSDSDNPLQDRISVYEVAVRQCQYLEIPMNGFINGYDKNATFEFGTTVQFACDIGFVLVGSPSIQCVVGNSADELVWNTSIPFCQEAPSTVIMTTMMDSNGTMSGIQNRQAGTIIGVTFAVVLLLFIIVILICILFRRYRKNKSSPQTEERVYVTVNKDSNNVLSSSVEGKSNVYASTDNNENGKQNTAYDRNDKAVSQHIYAASEVNNSSVGLEKPKSPTNSSDLPYDYADVKKEVSHARTPTTGNLYASVKKGKDKSSDLSYDKPGDTSARSSSSELPYDYAEVNKVVPSARKPPGVQHAGVKDTKDVSYNQSILVDKSPGQSSSSELPYDYADVTKVVPGARMPPGNPPASANNGDQASSTKYDLPNHSNKPSGPEEAAPYAYAYAGVNKDKSTGQTTSTESPYDYADVKSVVPGPRMPPGFKTAKARDEDQASNYDQPIHNNKSVNPANEPAPYAYSYASVNKDKHADRQQSAHLYAYADANELNKNKSSNSTPNGHQEDNCKEGWAENTLYGKSGKKKESPKQEDGTNGGTDGWKKNSIYQSGAAPV